MTPPGSLRRASTALFCAVACLTAIVGVGISSATTREEAIELCTRELVDKLGAQVVRDPEVRRHDSAPFVYGSADYADATGVRFRCRVYKGKVRSVHHLVSDRSFARGWAWVDERPRGPTPAEEPDDATIDEAVKAPPSVVRPLFKRPPE